jgi:hypothetical protein
MSYRRRTHGNRHVILHKSISDGFFFCAEMCLLLLPSYEYLGIKHCSIVISCDICEDHNYSSAKIRDSYRSETLLLPSIVQTGGIVDLFRTSQKDEQKDVQAHNAMARVFSLSEWTSAEVHRKEGGRQAGNGARP